MSPLIHPSFRTLERYVDDELAASSRRRTARHLADCARCRERVAWLQALPEDAARATEVSAPSGALQKILERRAAGEREILPVAGPPTGGRDFRLMGAVAVALAAIVVAGIVLLPSAGPLQAQRSELRFDPGEPGPGSRVEVEYRSHGTMPPVDRLVLRARFRMPGMDGYPEDVPHAVATTLIRTDEGFYRGSFVLPDSVVYAAFAVETRDGKSVDSNARRLWELLVHGSNRVPLYDALEQRSRDMMGRSWEEAYASVRRLTRLYPDRPEAWSRLVFYEGQLLGEAVDTLLPSHRMRFERLDANLERRDALPAEQVYSMGRYASHVGDSARAEYWFGRLSSEHPSHSVSMQRELNEIVQRHGFDSWREVWREEEPIRDPEALLEDLEEFWRERGSVGSTRADVFQYVGTTVARAAGDVAAYRTWVMRRHEARPDDPISSAFALIRYPPTRDEGMAWLRSIYERMLEVPDSARLLRHTADEQREAWSGTKRFVLKRLADVILEDGRPVAALDTLRLAASHGWDAQLFREVAALELRVGDTLAAMTNLARAAVDPVAGDAVADSVEKIIGRELDPQRWRALREEASREMRERVLARADRQSIQPDGIELVDARGERRSLGEVVGEEVAVVAFWSRWCGPAVAQLEEIQEVMSGLRARGIPSFLVTEEEVDEDLLEFLRERGVSIPIYQDARREASNAFTNFGTPSYYVLGPGGDIRFRESGLHDLPTQVSVLKIPSGSRSLRQNGETVRAGDDP